MASNRRRELRNIVYKGSLAEAAYLHTSMLIKWFDEQDLPVHPNMKRSNQELSIELNLGSIFLEQHIATRNTG